MPILNSGIGKEVVEPLSGETVVETASRASSRWCEGTMEFGRERRMYLLGLDMIDYVFGEFKGLRRGLGAVSGLRGELGWP